MSVFAALALAVPLLAAGPLLLHEHGGAGHHLHVLPESPSSESDWHEHQHDEGRAGEQDEEPLEPGVRSMPPGLVLHGPASWTIVASSELGQRLGLAAAFRAPCPRWAVADCELDAPILPRSEWPPPGGSSSGVRGLLLKSHALLL